MALTDIQQLYCSFRVFFGFDIFPISSHHKIYVYLFLKVFGVQKQKSSEIPVVFLCQFLQSQDCRWGFREKWQVNLFKSGKPMFE